MQVDVGVVALHAGVGDHHVQLAEALDSLLDHGLKVTFDSDVCRDREAAPSGGADLGRHRINAGRWNAGQGYRRAALGH